MSHRTTRRTTTLLAGVTAAAAALALAAVAAPAASAAPRRGPTVDQADTYRVVREIGQLSYNRTDLRYGVYGTDLGSMFSYRGKTYMVFGDTFGGPNADDFFSVAHEDWRSNVMAVSSDRDPRDGLRFDRMITDRPGHAKELLSSLKQDNVEQTVIPTYGTADRNAMYLHYMSVKHFGEPGHWDLNYSGIAVSRDGGQNWRKKTPVTWPGDSNFGQVAFTTEGRYTYLYGIPGGRYGGVQLARVPTAQLLQKKAYRYWTGTSWSTALGRARTIVPPNVGELSVRWNSHYQKWLMMYLIDDRGEVVIRTADRQTGPWSDPQVVVTAKDYPSLYAPFITPTFNGGKDIWFTMSQFGRYDVSMMHTSLDRG